MLTANAIVTYRVRLAGRPAELRLRREARAGGSVERAAPLNSIDIYVRPHAMHAVATPLSIVSRAIRPHEHTVPVISVIQERARVRGAVRVCHSARSSQLVSDPHAFSAQTVRLLKDTMPMPDDETSPC